MIPQNIQIAQISQELQELKAKYASCQTYIVDLKAERDQLAAENTEQRETIADQAEQLADQAAEISRNVTKISEHDQEWNRLYRLLSNPELSLTQKLFLWMYRRKVLELHPEVTTRTRVCLEKVAAEIGFKRDTARRCNKSLVEKTNTITLEHEKTELENGDTVTFVYVTLDPIIDKNPEFIHQEGGNCHGGKREYTCKHCGEANIDRFVAQYCRDCDKTGFYGLPGTRADAKVDAVINSIIKEHGQKQVASTPNTSNIRHEPPISELTCNEPHQSNEQTAATVAAVAVAEPVAISQKQDAFGTPTQKQPLLRCNCGALNWEWNNLRQRWLCGWCNSTYNRLI